MLGPIREWKVVLKVCYFSRTSKNIKLSGRIFQVDISIYAKYSPNAFFSKPLNLHLRLTAHIFSSKANICRTSPEKV